MGCGRDRQGPAADPLFEQMSTVHTNVDFSNDLSFDDSFNIYTYKDFYAGGGVGLGDVNGDGLLDIYLVANQRSNRLYLNQGDFAFEDITEEAGVGGSKPWATGVSMVDINGDGLLDIYVTHAGAPAPADRANELFVNNGDLTFTEKADDYGLADRGYSIHAAFFDYDRDGDLDMYLLNNFASKPIGQYNLQNIERDDPSFEGGDRFYINRGDSFEEVTGEVGIYSSRAGFGLGVSVGDIDRDGWMDIYVSNDFFERDYLYLNNGDGTFREVLENTFSSTSTTSMGGDIADLNNDGYPEIFVTDMLPQVEERLKTVADFIGWEQYRSEVEMGYHRKFTRNTLQYNNGDGTFSEIGRYAGVDATGWSWGALMADFDLDGSREIFVPNGFYKDVTNKDHLIKMRRKEVLDQVLVEGRLNYEKLVEMTPSMPIPNYLFERIGDLRYKNVADRWGLDQEGFSHGSAYGDLDRDGDLDLVVNNVNMESFILRNRTLERSADTTAAGWLQVELQGESPNTMGVGAQAELRADGQRWYLEQMPQRGFQSSMDPLLHAGLGSEVSVVDTLTVFWPDGRVTVRTDIPVDQKIVVRQGDARQPNAGEERGLLGERSSAAGSLLVDITEQSGIEWSHEESSFNDFQQYPLLLHMRSTEGPPLCVGDLNGDDREDLFVGGARDQAGAVFIQVADGRFKHSPQPELEADRGAEDASCELFDADQDGTLDLYVGSGSSEFPAASPNLTDRLYRVSENGKLTRRPEALPDRPNGPRPTGVVRAADFDGDGDQDLFVGTRMGMPYGRPVGGRLLINAGDGTFSDATSTAAPELTASKIHSTGLTGAAWGDLNGDGAPDLAVVGEWMPITIFYNQQGRLTRADPDSTQLGGTTGWWHSVALADLNGDGRSDIIGGNHGLNSRFRASRDQPVQLWVGDFNGNGRAEHIYAAYNEGRGPFPVALRQDLIQELPYLKSRYPTFAAYAGVPVGEMFSKKQLEELSRGYEAEEMASVVAWNRGAGRFSVESLPFEAQLAPMYAVLPVDLAGTRSPEILMGGNLDAVKPQAGPYDASFGAVLRYDSSGALRGIPARRSGFSVRGEIRGLKVVTSPEGRLLVVARNNDTMQVYRMKPN